MQHHYLLQSLPNDKDRLLSEMLLEAVSLCSQAAVNFDRGLLCLLFLFYSTIQDLLQDWASSNGSDIAMADNGFSMDIQHVI